MGPLPLLLFFFLNDPPPPEIYPLPLPDALPICAVLADELPQPLVDLVPPLGRHHRLERRRGDLDREIERARMPRIDDAGVGCRVSGASEERRDVFDGLLRCRESEDRKSVV